MLLVWRRKWATILEVLVPVVFAGLLVLIRSLQMPTVYDEPFDYNSLSPIITEQFYWLDGYNLAYAPQHPALLPLMARVKESMAITEEFQIYATPEEMNTALVLDDTRSTLAGIIFEGLDAAALTLPDDLHAIIRFPAELRSLSNPMALIDNWQTNSLFPFFSTGGPRNHKAHTGGRPPGYFEERFTTVQSAISQAFVEIKAEQEAEDSVLRNLLVKRFPEGPRTIDDLLFVMQLFVGLIMFLGFLYPAINNVKVCILFIVAGGFHNNHFDYSFPDDHCGEGETTKGGHENYGAAQCPSLDGLVCEDYDIPNDHRVPYDGHAKRVLVRRQQHFRFYKLQLVRRVDLPNVLHHCHNHLLLHDERALHQGKHRGNHHRTYVVHFLRAVQLYSAQL